MLEYDCYYTETCPVYNDFSSSYFTKEDSVSQLRQSVVTVDNGRDFSFYTLNLSTREKEILSNVSIDQFYTKHFKLSELSDKEKYFETIISEAINITKEENNIISRIILKLIDNVVLATSLEDAEVVIRTERPYRGHNCTYWHIDKNYHQIFEGLQLASDGLGDYSKIFIVPLIGAPTQYVEATIAHKQAFMLKANESSFSFGHTARCQNNDEISVIFNANNSINTPRWHGSVHLTGENGTVHAVPEFSKNGRLLLLITPLTKIKT